MELLCPAFVAAVPRLLDGAAPAVLTVAERGQGLIAQIKGLIVLERWVRDRLRGR